MLTHLAGSESVSTPILVMLEINKCEKTNKVYVLAGLQVTVLSTQKSSDFLLLVLLFLALLITTGIIYKYREFISQNKNRIVVISLAILAASTALGLYIYQDPSDIKIVDIIDFATATAPFQLVATVVTLIMTYVGTLVLDSVTQKMVEEDGRQVVDEHRREIIFRIFQLILYAFVTIALLNYWDVDIRNILIGAGTLAAIIGLSARHTLSAALAGIVLLFSRPFKVGDWISVGDTEGTVRRITIVNTILQTPNDEQVVIPNDVISERKIKNKNKTNKLRIPIDMEVSYEDNVDNILKVMEDAVLGSDIVADIPEPKAHIESFKDSGIKIRIFIWIKKPTPRRRTVARATAYKNVKEAFDNRGICVPYPRRRIEVSDFDEVGDETQEDVPDQTEDNKIVLDEGS